MNLEGHLDEPWVSGAVDKEIKEESDVNPSFPFLCSSLSLKKPSNLGHH